MAGQPITLTIPAVGTAGTTYASQINTALSTLETELERKVVPADMTINAGLSFLSSGSYYPATDLKYVQLSLQSESALAAASYPMSLFAGSTDGELYFNDNSGRQIQITTNGSVNVSTSGGITGSGYGATGVEVRWDSGDGEYEFRSGSGTNDYADARLDDVLLSDGSTNFVTLTAQAMVSDYILTLPAAVPASTSVVQMSATGFLTASPSGNIATTGTVATGALTVTGSASVSTTLGVTGLITANAGITVASGENITLAGDGRLKHGLRTLTINALCGQGSSYTVDPLGQIQLDSTSSYWQIPLPLQVGWVLTAIVFYLAPAGTGSKDIQLISRTEAGVLTTNETRNFTTSAQSDYELTLSPEVTVTAGTSYWVKFEAGNVNDIIQHVEVIYYQP